MRPVVEYREFETTFEGEVIPMSMDEDSLVHLMNQYIDLYEFPKQAILREYSTNAHDSHVAAGHTDPIEVTLPSALSQTLVIKDHGIGLSYDDIKGIYSKYGASTKRESDEFNGILGLGCKAGLAYAMQFTLQAVKHGIRTTASISRDNRGAASIHIVERDQATVEPNGVTITIPTAKGDTFIEEADRIFRYWPEDSVLVNGQRPKRFESQKINDRLYVHKQANDGEETSMVVMGNVAYPVPSTYLWGINDLDRNYVITAFVPMGAVEFVPAREGLRMTTLTKDTLRAFGTEIAEGMQKAAVDEVAAAPTALEAVATMLKWYGSIPASARPKTWAWNGMEVPTKLKLTPIGDDESGLQLYPRFTVVPFNNNRAKNQNSREEEVSIGTLADAEIFYGFGAKFSSTHREKINLWQADHEGEPRHYVLLPDEPPDEWLDWLSLDRIHPFDEVKAYKLPKKEAGGGYSNRRLGSYDAFVPGSSYHREILASEIDDTQPIFYYVGNQSKAQRNRYRYSYEQTREEKTEPYRDAMKLFEAACTVVMLPETRLARFKRDFPMAKELTSEVEKKFNRFKGRLAADTLVALDMHDQSLTGNYRALKDQQIDDPAVQEAIRIAQMDIANVVDKRSAFAKVGLCFPIPNADDLAVINPLRNYPLIHALSRDVVDDAVLYINAAYAARQQQEQN